jgi:hypothetical protein
VVVQGHVRAEQSLIARNSKQSETWDRHPIKVVAHPTLRRFSVTGDIGTGSAGVLAKAIAKNSEIRLITLTFSRAARL